MRAHASAASGTSSQGDRIRRCTSSPNAAIVTSERPRKPTESEPGVEDRDHHDRQQVVDDGEGEQERAQRGRQVGADDGQDGEGERDVGRRGDRPAAQRAGVPAEVEQDEQERGHRHAADRGGHGQRRPPRLAQVPGDELALELEARDEEEDRQEPVGGPGAERQVQVQRRGSDPGVAQGRVAARPRGVRPDEGHGRRAEQEGATDGLAPEHRGDAAGLGPGSATEEAGGGTRHGASPGGGVGKDVADQTSRRTGSDPTGRAAPGPAP